MTNKLPQKFGTLFLTVILITGIFIPSCEVEELEKPCDPALTNGCGCPPTEYFDIQGLELRVREKTDLGEEIAEQDTVAFENVMSIYVDYLVDYHTSSHIYPQPQSFFSTMASAYACSIIYTPLGSKNEAISSFDIITLNDFDEEHKANESINDLLTFSPLLAYLETEYGPLTEFLDNNTGNLLQEDMQLILSKAPILNPEFHVKVVMELSTGELYEAESKPFILLP